ncbi:MAG: (Fe-S)-binding protein, partial [Deltaproteobacteria bacterium]|nr:(Fe-S)-binding protein [Deltaproteobacteria bacterium]
MPSLFLTCAVDVLYPAAGRAAVRVLEALGGRVRFPEDQTCCGQPWINSGDPGVGRRLAERYLRTFETAEAVVCLSSSCADTVRSQYPRLFEGSPGLRERVEALGAKTYEFCEYLHSVLGVGELPAHPEPRSTTYHGSCRTLRGVGLKGVAEGYLRQMLGDAFVPLPDLESCCGFGGTFSVKLPEISGRLMADKLRAIDSTGAEVV